jgi:hypothetical protein
VAQHGGKSFLLPGNVERHRQFIMSLPSATLAVLSALLLIGCATKENQITPAQAALERQSLRELEKEEGAY